MRSGRLSFFAAASWLVPFFVFLMMQLYDEARPRERLSLVPNFTPLLVQLGITAGLAFSLGLLSFLRHERLSLVAAIPCFFGGLYLCGAALLALLKAGELAVRATQRAPYLTVGILLALNGAFLLAWFLPRARARLAREQEANGSDEKDTRRTAEAVKLFGIATLIVGVVLMLIHTFELF